VLRHAAKLTDAQARELAKRALNGENIGELAIAYGVCDQTARNYCYREGVTPTVLRAARRGRQ